MPTELRKRHRFQRGGPMIDQMCGTLIDGRMCCAVADAEIHQMGDIERAQVAGEPQDIVVKARELAEYVDGLAAGLQDVKLGRAADSLRQLCDEVERLRQCDVCDRKAIERVCRLHGGRP